MELLICSVSSCALSLLMLVAPWLLNGLAVAVLTDTPWPPAIRVWVASARGGVSPTLVGELKAETQGQAQPRSAQAQRGRLREPPCTRGERSSLAALAVAVAVASGVDRRRKRRGRRPAPSGGVL